MGDREYDFDTSVAHPARVYDYWLGGKDNFEADRRAAEEVIAVRPGIRYDIRANRDFLGRAVRWLAGEAGIRQFLDIGTGIPAAGNTHQIAQEVAPSSRIVYVDNDPIVLVHARALLTGSDAGATAYIDGDLRDPAPILATARQTLDLGRPVAVLLIGVLHLIADEEDPAGIIAELMAAVPPGSFLAITQPASDVNVSQAAAGQQRYNSKVATKQTRRTRDETAAFLGGPDLVEPGVVQCHRWKPAAGADLSREVSGWAAVGRKIG
ncbi:SAM-dependent methyltransferase [Paractinoplanes toevensis]|uniref:SAM-dependent methyltransferase n=1 Tax=Paractinoplanes toevensis TaxID=571911 RepID=A0A919W2L7_9ACTN|nr:SAM-dependent methyltransferase [Actinoplanes toevensis]GIM93752.1 hypothetical protein Ato02nite_055450 [Actinoplanes toevensis]